MSTAPFDSGSVNTTASGLLVRLQSSDAEAWRQFVRLYCPLVYRWCRQADVAPQDAADVGQEVFRNVFLSIRQFHHDRAGDTFRGWLWTITQNKIRDHFRRQANRPRAVGGSSAGHSLAEAAASAEGFSTPDDAGGLSTLLARGLDAIRCEFEDRTWQAFWRVAVRSELPGDVAADLGTTANAVRKAKCRVLARLRAVLGEAIPGHGGSPPR
jgi:RNA polymerase sigma-70 factor (ECF subfamily)